MNNQSPSEVLGNLASIASLNPFSPFTMGLNDILDMVKTDELSVSTGDNPVTKEEVKKAIDNSDCIVIDSLKYAPLVVEKNKVSKDGTPRPVASCGGLVKQIKDLSHGTVDVYNALFALAYDTVYIRRYLRITKMSIYSFLGSMSKPQLIQLRNYLLQGRMC